MMLPLCTYHPWRRHLARDSPLILHLCDPPCLASPRVKQGISISIFDRSIARRTTNVQSDQRHLQTRWVCIHNLSAQSSVHSFCICLFECSWRKKQCPPLHAWRDCSTHHRDCEWPSNSCRLLLASSACYTRPCRCFGCEPTPNTRDSHAKSTALPRLPRSISLDWKRTMSASIKRILGASIYDITDNWLTSKRLT
jgi:hypothetical protein